MTGSGNSGNIVTGVLGGYVPPLERYKGFSCRAVQWLMAA
jgi:hypothetical protein